MIESTLRTIPLCKRTFGLLLSAWILLSLAQTAQFYFYYEQPLTNSLRWSFRDWFVWVLIFALAYPYIIRDSRLDHWSVGSLLRIIPIALALGLLQVVIIVSLDFIAGTASRPFHEDIAHFYNKRWLQYLLMVVVFWLVIVISRNTTLSQTKTASKIQFKDGKKSHWIELDTVTMIQASGNYVSFFTETNELVIRMTMKAVLEKLEAEQFIQISRSCIVNRKAIVSTESKRGKVTMTLSSQKTVSAGPTYSKRVKSVLNL